MPELTDMRNIGKEMARKLASVGIASLGQLEEIGAKQAFLTLKQRYPHICLVHLYALEGAIQNIGFDSLPEDTKKDLKAFSNFLKQP